MPIDNTNESDSYADWKHLQSLLVYLNCALMLKFYGKEATRELLEKTDNALGVAHDEQLLDKLSNPVIRNNILRTYHRLFGSHTNADIGAQPFSLAPLILESAGVEVSKEALNHPLLGSVILFSVNINTFTKCIAESSSLLSNFISLTALPSLAAKLVFCGLVGI